MADMWRTRMRTAMINESPREITEVLDAAKHLADGGEGTTETLIAAAGGRLERRQVSGPLGEPSEAAFGVLPDGRGVVEVAAASGYALLRPEQRDPRRTTSYGTGELLRAAHEAGCRELIVGLGGSATNDFSNCADWYGTQAEAEAQAAAVREREDTPAD